MKTNKEGILLFLDMELKLLRRYYKASKTEHEKSYYQGAVDEIISLAKRINRMEDDE